MYEHPIHPHYTKTEAEQKAYWDAEIADVNRRDAERKAEYAGFEKHKGASLLWGNSTGRTVETTGMWRGWSFDEIHGA